ncbi:MAG: sodium:calcium antiporter [Firmicutes bacterium]|nr:sodium:calcium antiporter [Bacillota bacterium]
MISGVLIILGLALILMATVYFTNGVEWLGYALKWNAAATGSILAAVGTAAPELIIPLVAIFFGKGSGHVSVGIGAILGSPLMLASLGVFITGMTAAYFAPRRSASTVLLSPSLQGDLRFFLGAWGATILSTWLGLLVHKILAIILVLAYGWHALKRVRSSHVSGDELVDPPGSALRLFPHKSPTFVRIFVQVALGLGLLIAGARLFVDGVTHLALLWRIPAFVLAVFITPLATEFPEVINSIVWVRTQQDDLATGNVIGALVIQASLGSAIGLAFTAFQVVGGERLIAVLGWAAAAWVYLLTRKGRIGLWTTAGSGVLYAIFIGLLVTVG